MVHAKFAASLLAAASTAMAAAMPQKTHPKTIPGAYIVEFDDNADATLFRRQAVPEYETRMELDFELFKGISIQLSDVDTAGEMAEQLASLPSVKKIWPIRVHPPPDDIVNSASELGAVDLEHLAGLSKRAAEEGKPKSDAQLRMTQIDKLHAKNITGEGITIAILDTGVDYHHPSLGGCFGEGCLVVRGYDLVGDAYDGDLIPAVPDNDPDDSCYGHGTHVAGIIAAQADRYMTGAAPGVRLAAYRVLGCMGVAADDVLIAGYNMAYEQGADIITASLGGNSGWAADPWAEAASRIVAKGVPCIVSAGNQGWGLFDAKAPASGKGVTAVASFDSTELPVMLVNGSFVVDGGEEKQFLFKNNKPSGFDNVSRKLWAVSHSTSNATSDDACSPLPSDTPDLSEFAVLVQRTKNCDFYTQVDNVVAKGTKFLILANYKDSVESFYADGVGLVAGAMVTKTQGAIWSKALADGSDIMIRMPVDETTVRQVGLFKNNDTGGMISQFTSWGPTFEMDLKPQVGAPGGYIFSLHPLELGSYATMSGTSMSAPLVAASFALIAQARGLKTPFDPALIEALLSSTAKAQSMQFWAPRQDWLAPPAQQGAGLVQVFDAAFSPAHLLPSSLSFNDTDNFVGTLNFTIFNTGDDEATYEISHVPTHTLYQLKEDRLQAYFWNASANYEEHAGLEFSTTKVTIAPGSSTAVAVTATPPKGLDPKRYPYWSGFITVNGTDGVGLALPYQGLGGSLRETKSINEDGSGFYIADPRNVDEPAPVNFTFRLPAPGEDADMSNYAVPAISTQFIWGSPEVRADLVPLTKCASTNSTSPTKTTINGLKSIGNIQNYPAYFNARAGTIVDWYGRMEGATGFAPPGLYKIVFQVLSIYGNASNEDDWFITETRPFRLQYDEPTE